jgi:hypothetical protein
MIILPTPSLYSLAMTNASPTRSISRACVSIGANQSGCAASSSKAACDSIASR